MTCCLLGSGGGEQSAVLSRRWCRSCSFSFGRDSRRPLHLGSGWIQAFPRHCLRPQGKTQGCPPPRPPMSALDPPRGPPAVLWWRTNWWSAGATQVCSIEKRFEASPTAAWQCSSPAAYRWCTCGASLQAPRHESCSAREMPKVLLGRFNNRTKDPYVSRCISRSTVSPGVDLSSSAGVEQSRMVEPWSEIGHSRKG